MEDKNNNMGPSERTPIGKLADQMDALDIALNTIKPGVVESEAVRAYIVGQIEALKWAIRTIGG